MEIQPYFYIITIHIKNNLFFLPCKIICYCYNVKYIYVESFFKKNRIKRSLKKNISYCLKTFEISIDEQVVAFRFEGKYSPKVPTCSVNDMLRNTVKHVIQAEGARQVVLNAVLDKVWTSGYVDLHHIRNLYFISNTLGTHQSMAVHGKWGILQKIPISAEYNKLI